uniref:Uncharacterized protein n=1 Tax=Anguilla anguilla TaxID=7936 RepID=A0A0E9VCF6_ANGAN
MKLCSQLVIGQLRSFLEWSGVGWGGALKYLLYEISWKKVFFLNLSFELKT